MSDESRPTERLGSLDGLRGLGALLVVAHHLALAFFPHSVLGALQRRNAGWEPWLHTFPGSLLVSGRFAVEVFFVLSGVVLARPFLGARDRGDLELASAAVKRCVRLLPMVLAGILAVVVPAWLGWVGSQGVGDATGSTMWLKARPEGSLDPLRVARVLFTGPFAHGKDYDSPLWTIGYEVTGSYVVFGLLFVARRSSWRWGLYAVSAAWLRSESTVPFIAGLVLADLDASWAGFRNWAARGWVMAAGLGVALYLGSFPLALDAAGRKAWCAWIPGLWRLGPGVLGVAAVLLVALVLGSPWLRARLDCAPGRWLGRNSYALYALHEPVLLTVGCAVYTAMATGWGHGPAAAAAMLATTAGTLAVAELGTRWVDRPGRLLADRVAAAFKSGVRPAGPGASGG